MASLAELLRVMELHVAEGFDFYKLYALAKINRIGFYFLHKIIHENNFRVSNPLRERYSREYKVHLNIMREFDSLNSTLRGCGISFAFFKSIRPYPFTTVDIDVLIFDNFFSAVKHLFSRGYAVLGSGPESVTFRSPGGVGVDLYREVAVSRVVYVDKDVLRKHVTTVKTPFGVVVNLSPEADLVVFANHALVKEHMFTLADYFTVKGLLLRSDVDVLSRLVLETRSVYVMGVVLGLVRDIVECVYGGREDKCPKLPLKFPPWVVARALWEKLGCVRCRRSWAYQFEYMLSFRRLNRIIRDIVWHIKRLTY